MSSYTYPIATAISEFLAIQPDPTKIVKTEIVNFNALSPEKKAKIAPLLKANVPAATALALVNGNDITYKIVVAMLAQSVAIEAINTAVSSISAYQDNWREGVLACLENGIAFDAAKTLIDRLRS